MEVLIKLSEYQKATIQCVVTAFYKLLSVNCFICTMKGVTTVPGPKGIPAAFLQLSRKIGHSLSSGCGRHGSRGAPGQAFQTLLSLSVGGKSK